MRFKTIAFLLISMWSIGTIGGVLVCNKISIKKRWVKLEKNVDNSKLFERTARW